MARRDEFDEDESFFDSILKKRGDQGHPGSLRRVLAVTAGLAVLGILGAVLWSTMSSDSAPSSEAVPIIRADADPYKTSPSEPGGMAVPNKDSTIFETLKGQSTDQAKVENLFEDAEKPVRKEDVFTAKTSEEAAPTEAAKEVASKMPKMPAVTYEDTAESEATPPVDVKPVETASVPSIIEELKAKPKIEVKTEAKTEEVAADKKVAAIQPAAGGNFYVQMAAVKSEADAKAQWPKYQAQYSALSGLPLRVQKADLGAKGTYYRIQGGPVTEADARKLCSTINGQKSGACVVAKR